MKTLVELYNENAGKATEHTARHLLNEDNPDDAMQKAQLDLVQELLRDCFHLIDEANPRLRALNLTPIIMLNALAGLSSGVAFDYGAYVAKAHLQKQVDCELTARVAHDLKMLQVFVGCSAASIVDGNIPTGVFAMLRLAQEVGR